MKNSKLPSKDPVITWPITRERYRQVLLAKRRLYNTLMVMKEREDSFLSGLTKRIADIKRAQKILAKEDVVSREYETELISLETIVDFYKSI